jgi:DNA-binding NarL/FixJ family response regulator
MMPPGVKSGRIHPGGEPPVEVLVVDDQELFRNTMRDVVLATPGMVCVGAADSGEAALEAIEELSPRLVIMDKRMQGMGGVAAARMIADSHPGVVVVLVSVELPEPEHLKASGAAVFLHKRELSPRGLTEVWSNNGR